MPDRSSKFNVVSQLSETVLARIIGALQTCGDFPTRWQGREPLRAVPLGIELGFSYDIHLGMPTLATESGDASKLALAFDFRGQLELDAAIDARPPVNASTHAIPIPFHGSLAAQLPLTLARIGTYAYLELAARELRDVAIHVEYDGDVGGNGQIFNRMIQRILLSNLNSLSSIPVSHGFEFEITGGWAVTNHALRIIDGPSPPDRDDVTIALNTWPNRLRGNRADLHDWVNPGFDFSICYDERFIVQALSQALSDDRIPRAYDDGGCPNPAGPVRVQDLAINLAANDLNVFVTATRNGRNFDARGRVKLSVDPGHVLHLQVSRDAGSLDFLKGIAAMMARSILAVADLDTFADPAEPDRPTACRARIFPAALCGAAISLVLRAPVPRTKVLLEYDIERIDVSENEITALGKIVISHS